MTREEALRLFRRLGVDPVSVSRKDFRSAYYRLAKRYHPDASPRTADLMAQINAARAAIAKSGGLQDD